MIWKSTAIFVSLSLALLASGTRTSRAEDASACQAHSDKVLFLLDISGSMAGEGIQTARDGLKKHLAGLPPEVEAGLMTFNGCEDDTIQMRVPIARGTNGQIEAAANSSYPDGSTALGKALERANQVAGAGGECVNIVLLSDGMDTCGGNPLGVAGQIGSTCSCLHVVAYGTSGWDNDFLRKLANAGHGNFCAVGKSDPEELKKCLDLGLSWLPSVVARTPGPVIDPKDPGTTDPKDPKNKPKPVTIPDCSKLRPGSHDFQKCEKEKEEIIEKERQPAPAGQSSGNSSSSGN